MQTKYIIVGVIVLALVGFVVFEKDEPVASPLNTNYETQNETINQTPETNTAPETSPEKTNEYTLADVSAHNNKNDCWTTINGGVYDVTPWIEEHPGGADAIISLCGIDGSSAFIDQHTGDKRPARELASFQIGTLK